MVPSTSKGRVAADMGTACNLTVEPPSSKLDWKISEVGNSGIFVLVDEQGPHIYSHAPEIQLLDNERHSDNKIDSHLSGSLYDLIASPPSSHRIAGEWNSITIRLQDRQLQVWQNNVKTTDIVIGSEQWQQLVAIKQSLK